MDRAALRISGWTLRSRLTAALALLLVGICLVIGTLSVLAMQRFMVDQLDRQLVTAAQLDHQRGATPRSSPLDRAGDPDDGRLPPGTPAGGLVATVRSGSVTDGGRLDDNFATQPLGTEQETRIAQVPADGRVHSLNLGSGFGDYRAVAMQQDDGSTHVTAFPLAGVDQTVTRLVTVIAAVTVIGLILTVMIGAAIVRGALRPMQRMAATARRVAELPLDQGDVALAERVPQADADPRTEVGQVGAALNRMLTHVAAALDVRAASENRMRRFVSDASHELRTPLASIRGYAELTRRGREDVPPMTAHALRRVESEAIRMTGLVEDLLLLARLDEKRPLARRPVDLTDLVVDAVGDAHAAAPGHRWRLDLPDEAVEVVGDRDRLHQVVANLLANARVHTPAGTTVEVGLATEDDGTVLLRVSDDGPGVPADLVPEVFDRFARADTSRTRDEQTAAANQSTGLGLAIVASVVQAHGGRVDLRSRPGCTEFTVVLPPLAADPDAAAPDAGAQSAASAVTSRR
jgi:two-component system, OmpR family, sensor kinase